MLCDRLIITRSSLLASPAVYCGTSYTPPFEVLDAIQMQEDTIPLITPSHRYSNTNEMTSPQPSPGFETFDKHSYLVTRNSGTSVPLLNRNFIHPLPPASPYISLWKRQVLAAFAGIVTLSVGLLGLLAFAGYGPLSTIFIPADRLKGPIVNIANIGAFIGGVGTLFSLLGTIVLTGVSRAWLRRQAVQGYGPSIKEWRTLAAGVSIAEAIRTPYLARGLVLVFTVLVAVQNSIFQGVALPGSSTRTTPYQYTNIARFARNGGQGAFTSCVVANKKPCAQFASTADIMTAFQRAIWLDLANSSYPVKGVDIKTSADFIGAALPPPPDTDFSNWTWSTPISTYTTTCDLMTTTGVERDQFSIESPCTRTTALYGNFSADELAFMYCDCCPNAQGTGINMTMSVAGWGVPDSIPNSTFGVHCVTTATESMGNGTYVYGSDATVVPAITTDFVQLSQDDMVNLGTAVLGALKSSSGTDGIPTLTHATMVQAVDPNTGKVVPGRIANGISNAFAAAAAAGYTTQLNSGYPYTNLLASLPAATIEEGFGWTRMSRLSGWSAVCILSGLVWLALAVYMHGGGTRYDPSDWYQTLNTSAASNISQKPGTCTGAHLKEKMVNVEHLWYGELAPGHVGFSQAPAPAIQTNVLYGAGAV